MPDATVMAGRSAVCITHAAAVTPLAVSLAGTWRALCRGEGGVRPLAGSERFAAFTSGYGALVPGLEQKGRQREGRSLLISLLDMLAQDMGQDWPLEHGRTFLYASSAKAGIDVLERGLGVSPGDVPASAWCDLLPGAMRDWARKRLGFSPAGGENVAAACASGAVALIRAVQNIAAGRCDSALVLAAEIVTPFTMSGFTALRAVSEHPCRPFDEGRDGLTLGEGAAALLVMSEEHAARLGLRPLARVAGWGMASDALHITAPAKDARGLRAALGSALNRAGEGFRPGAICAHGTGTVYNDAMELTAFEHTFSELPPFFSAKGALGHAMAASGAIEAALCLHALGEGRIPPTVGVERPETRCRGMALDQCQEFTNPGILSCNAGFGGLNAVLALARPSREGA